MVMFLGWLGDVMKKMIRDDIDVIDILNWSDGVSSTIDEFMSRLVRLKEQYPTACIEPRECDYYNTYQFKIYYDREETDEEYAARVVREDASKRQNLEFLRRQVEQLGYSIVPKQ